MIVWNGLERCPPGTVAAASIGNYDGVHLGHQAILRRVVASGRARGAAALLITFDPHPSEVVAPERRPRLLQTAAQRLAALQECGLDAVLAVGFDAELAALPGEGFLDRLSGAGLRLASVHVGTGFRFGRHRDGDLALLARLGAERGFAVEGVAEVRVEGQVVSSSAVRSAVEAGEVERAHRMLGRPFAVMGEVVRGEGRGRTLDVPTANVHVANEMVPRPGVYVTETHVLGARFPAVTNVGFRPTFEGARLTVEAHLIDFDGDLYDQRAEVLFLARLRDERRFASREALVAQIGRDRAAAVDWFRRMAGARP